MSKLEWNDGLSVGIQAIDDDHKKLINLISELSDAIDNHQSSELIANTFERLEDYAKQHFAREESFMASCHYQELAQHQKRHRQFIDNIPQLKERLITAETIEAAEEVNLYLLNWLTHHIVDEDLDLAKLADTQHEKNAPSTKQLNQRLTKQLPLRRRILLTLATPMIGLLITASIIIFQAPSAPPGIETLDGILVLIITITLLAFGMATTLLISSINRSITQPVKRIAQAMTGLSLGRRDIRVKEPHVSGDLSHIISAYEKCRRNLLKSDFVTLTNLRREQIAHQHHAAEEEHYKAIALTDPLTGAINRRGFDIASGKEWERAMRYKRPLTFMMLDIDHFKKVNDQYGHQCGDIVLQAFHETCHKCTRECDIVARLGGEEFGILLPEITASNATILAERIRNAIEALNISADSHTIKITVSIGISELKNIQNKSMNDLIKQADLSLYEAKNQGRNRVIVYNNG